MTDYDFPTQAALLDAMRAGQRWTGYRTAPVDDHPDLTLWGGLRVETTAPAKGNPGAFLVDVGPALQVTTPGYEVVVDDPDPGEDLGGAAARLIGEAVAQWAAVRGEDAMGAVVDATQNLRAHQLGVEDAVAAWREAIRAALADGQRVVDVAEVAGISRERVYQIRDGR